jgi:hypothetical protein
MKNIFSLIAAAALCGLAQTTFAQVDASLVTKFVDQAKSASDNQLGTIATELTGKLQALSTAAGANDAVKSKLNSTLTALIGGKDSDALTSAFQLAESAKLTPEQIGLAKQAGNLASAYVVQKNFAALPGAQSDVATIVSSLRKGQITSAVPALQSVAKNASLTDPQKQLIKTIGEKYAPGFKKASDTLNGLKKLPGF